MSKTRLEAFSDAVLAIVITIMVIELRPPHEESLLALHLVWPVFSSYALSFLYLAIYWNNHHHLLQAAERVDGRILWANMHLLFWLSLVPFATAWMGESHFAEGPVALYGIVLLGAAVAYVVLARALVALHGAASPLSRALGRDLKGRLSLALYLAAIVLAHARPWAACGLYVLVAALWLRPDGRIEDALASVRRRR